MPNVKLWVRAGDGDNYNDFDGLEEVADYLAEMSGQPDPLDWCNEYGVTSPEISEAENYISLLLGVTMTPSPSVP